MVPESDPTAKSGSGMGPCAAKWPLAAERLAEVLDNVRGLVWIKGLDGRILFANRFAEELFGRPRQEIVGRTAFDLFPAEDAERYARTDREVLADGILREYEDSAPSAAGRRFFQVVKFLLRDVAGAPCAVAAICTEVTEQRQAAVDLRASEARWRLQSAALEAAADAVVITDRDGSIEWANRAFTELTGYTLEEAQGRNSRELLRSGVHGPELYGELWSTILDGRTWRGELVNRRKDGTLYDEEMSITPVRDERGNVTHFVAVKQDVTERRRAATAVQRFVAGSPTVLYALRPVDGGFRGVWVSDNVTALTGFAKEEPLREGWWAENVHPDDRARAIAAHPLPAGADHSVLEYRFRRADGSYLWLRDEKRMVRDAAGRPVEIIGSWSDVTERVRLEEQYRQSQKMEAIGRLAGGVAHDFNNLLTVIGGSAEMLAASLPADSGGRSLLGEIRDATDRAASLTRQLLAFSRSQVLAPRAVDLNAGVANIETLLRRLIGEDVLLETSLSPAAGCVLIDPGQLEQVIVNLAVNARDAMPRGGRLRVATRAAELDAAACRRFPEGRPGRYAVLSIADTGCGMTPEVRARIFEPFFTTKPQGTGTGLGLATVFGIVRQSEGQIEVESRAGAGARFDVYLPSVAAPAAEARAEPRAANEARGKETILVVEDEEALRKLARIALERQGYRVLAASDGRQALAAVDAAGDTIDLLVTDLVLPQM
ncbi:MAG TPA: PAS domain S-box protein, partial [Thermoanaerobaculia bacterium]|nr:PAS domain S-box protein [Thermoanaerobaculia bacterium]